MTEVAGSGAVLHIGTGIHFGRIRHFTNRLGMNMNTVRLLRAQSHRKFIQMGIEEGGRQSVQDSRPQLDRKGLYEVPVCNEEVIGR